MTIGMKPRVTQQGIEKGLRDLGLGEGDIVLLHSSLSSFGMVEGGARAVVDAFLSVLGESGTLVVPTFGALGVVTEVVREDPRAVLSNHPIAGVAAIGAAAEEICKDHWRAETAHGEGTPYLRIAERGGYVCLAGVDQDRNTTLHTAEELLGVPYMKDRTVTFVTEEGEVTRSVRRFPGPHRDFIGLDRLFRQRGILRVGRIGSAVIRLMRSREMIDVCVEAGRADPAFALCDNPNCTDCVGQRADIRRDRLSRESFTLVASSGLAGRTVAEMVDNLKANGLDHVELDMLQGQPAHCLNDEQLRTAVRALRDCGVGVSSVRSASAPDCATELMDMARDCGVARVVLPLSEEARTHATLAAQRGLRLSLFNNIQGSEQASQMLLALRQEGLEVGFTFSAASFARAGERPFLFSYKQKLRQFIDQLDLEDICFDGTAQPLAFGNAELKEMVSMLRCASFDGPMVLTAGNGQVGDLGSAVERFEALLDTM
ncbi:MAG: AAC(3) family N-acetyltransferase [Phycisphaerae bacterium]|nr:AAC(3) family N-acetyltransferase [Phycisphaerae bacterium]